MTWGTAFHALNKNRKTKVKMVFFCFFFKYLPMVTCVNAVCECLVVFKYNPAHLKENIISTWLPWNSTTSFYLKFKFPTIDNLVCLQPPEESHGFHNMYPSRNKSELNQRISFLCLANELLCHIFGFLTGFGEVTNSMLTCRRFYDFFRRNKQWEKKILIAKNTREKIKMMSQLYYPIGEPSISLMDKLLHDANSIPNFIETMLSQYVFSYER